VRSRAVKKVDHVCIGFRMQIVKLKMNHLPYWCCD
jgi:hypothetical protein